MFQTRIGNLYNSLTNSEKTIANYILANNNIVKKMTSYNLADEINVGQSTIIRFTKKLGYTSFRELLADIHIQNESSLDLEDITADETVAQTNYKIISRYYEVLSLTFEYNPSTVFEDCTTLLTKADSIICVGAGASNDFARYLSAQLITAGISAKTYDNLHLLFSEIIIMKKTDVIILFSESGESREIVFAAKKAKERDVKIIAITKNTNNSLRKYADVTLSTVHFDVRNMIRTASIRVSQLCVADMLLLNLLKTNIDYFREKSKEGRRMINEVFPKLND